MTVIAPTLQAFFTERLIKQRDASPRTIASYRDTLRLLLTFVNATTGREPSQLEWDELDEPVITAFLRHLEHERHNTPRTRNLRLTAIRSLFRYAALRHPEHAAVFQRVLSIPPARFDRRTVSFLTQSECEALIDAPDLDRWEGRRDRAMIMLTIHAGLRVSELTQVNRGDLTLGTGAHVRVTGKGRRERAVPLTLPATAVLDVWIAERGGNPADPLFPTRTGRRLSRDAVAERLHVHTITAEQRCETLRGKRVHPHVLRHSCAMALLQAGVDSTVIALWLGHANTNSTQAYIHADMTIKERALALLTPSDTPPGRYTPSDNVLRFLDELG
ncbi:MAG: tyrosine-type recombinase/integrase [Solirubrobacteraceae bacterium]